MDRASLLAFVRGQEEAGRVARELRADEGAPPPAVAFARALDLLDLGPEPIAWTRTDAEARGIEEARAAWIRVKAKWVP